jgi:hypothetical protein
MKNMKLCICICTIGRESLRPAAEFALAALDMDTSRDTELLIVDDRKIQDKPLALPSDARIRTVRGRGMGWCGPARNTGLQEAKSDWVIFCDDDDLLHPYCAKWLRQTLTEAPLSDIVIWRTVGQFQHLPPDYAIPPAESTTLQLGLVCNALCIRPASGIRYGETILRNWIKPGYEHVPDSEHEHRHSIAPDDDFQMMMQAREAGKHITFSRYVAYGVNQAPPLQTSKFPLVIL